MKNKELRENADRWQFRGLEPNHSFEQEHLEPPVQKSELEPVIMPKQKDGPQLTFWERELKEDYLQVEEDNKKLAESIWSQRKNKKNYKYDSNNKRFAFSLYARMSQNPQKPAKTRNPI